MAAHTLTNKHTNQHKYCTLWWRTALKGGTRPQNSKALHKPHCSHFWTQCALENTWTGFRHTNVCNSVLMIWNLCVSYLYACASHKTNRLWHQLSALWLWKWKRSLSHRDSIFWSTDFCHFKKKRCAVVTAQRFQQVKNIPTFRKCTQRASSGNSAVA